MKYDKDILLKTAYEFAWENTQTGAWQNGSECKVMDRRHSWVPPENVPAPGLPNARQIAYIPKPALWDDDAREDGMQMPRDDEWKMPDAWREIDGGADGKF
ncbi:hypothetical protein P1J78_21755 [Psychromarinibacter sp. C21-152]|uniref:Uncharacterized protein n=1 Tax=Psychromarinibacter sediminicola TaxID=3033385 RepID=A0AAE3NZ43_9RHOB|nr:hypothetical protein [Psychromarinibacter sediminicola]MDF0603362.1 hypothetical protein [Psychromarinibacter sediminicola]